MYVHRFRTYFPDAYKQHYPNAKTHLSSRIRASLPDGKSLFEKTRSKKRRPFTEDEDRALKAGYEKHGTVWAAIVRDPIFQEQNRRSTDLRDRFRNAFPDLYEAAGYKPRPAAKKKRGDVPAPVRAATDDQLPPGSLLGPARRKRAHTTESLFRRGTKSVPESTTNSDDEDSGGEDDDAGAQAIQPSGSHWQSQAEGSSTREIEMGNSDPLTDPLSIPDFVPSSSQISDATDSSQMWCPTPEPTHLWSSTNPGSPTSSHISSSDFFAGHSHHRRNAGPHHMIGKSAWGAQDWFSANPRLEPSTLFSSDSPRYDGLSPTPSSPFSFHTLSHGVVDRYDLFPTSFPHDFSSEVGMGDSHSAFSDQEMFASSSFRGFTHHSNYAGDLIFGSRTHQPQHHFDYGPGFGFGAGLGLSGMQQSSSNAHSMQLPTSNLPGIDEIELNAISLNDDVEVDNEMVEVPYPERSSSGLSPHVSDVCQYDFSPRTLEDLVGLSQHSTPPATPIMSSRAARTTTVTSHVPSSLHNRSLSVPPSEHRPTVPHRQSMDYSHTQGKFPATPIRSTALFNGLPSLSNHNHNHTQPHATAHAMLPPSTPSVPQLSTVPHSSSSLADALKHHNHEADVLAFLDLHNYHNGMGMTYNSPEYAIERQGQALDLAANSSAIHTANASNPISTFSAVPSTRTPSIPHGMHGFSSLGQQVQHARAMVSPGMGTLHQRGLSAVSPHDLMLKQESGFDNKRKRASWDGGVS
jgi:hypothetical protein